MSFYYPFPSSLKSDVSTWREGRDYVVWYSAQTIEELIRNTTKPIIEIGGPTDLGFYFLDGLALPSKPIITNISDNPLPFAADAEQLASQVEDLVDARKMPYKDESVGCFLMAAMSLSSDWWVGLSEVEKEKSSEKFEEEFDKAKMEMGLVATGVTRPDGATHAQRIQIYREVHRTLVSGGLFFSDGSLEDITILRQLGLNLIAFLQYQDHTLEGWQSLSYEFVVRK